MSWRGVGSSVSSAWQRLSCELLEDGLNLDIIADLAKHVCLKISKLILELYYEAATPAEHGMINMEDIATHTNRWLVSVVQCEAHFVDRYDCQPVRCTFSRSEFNSNLACVFRIERVLDVIQFYSKHFVFLSSHTLL